VGARRGCTGCARELLATGPGVWHSRSVEGVVKLLGCDECGIRSDPEAGGWLAYHGRTHEGAEKETWLFCPECCAKEILGVEAGAWPYMRRRQRPD